jgi:hypothetical protein
LGVCTTSPEGNVSEIVTPVRVTVSGFVMVIVMTELVPVPMAVGAKVLAIVGGLLTGRVAVATKPEPPFVELTLPVVFVAMPAVLSVTLAVMVQFELAPEGMDPPLRLKLEEPIVAVVKVPPQVVAPAVDNVIPDGSVSVTPTPVRATELAAGLVMVMVIVDVPFNGMPAALEPNPLVIVGGATTVRVALAVVPAPPLVELTAPVVLFRLPAVVPVTLTTKVQFELTPSEPPVRLTLPAPWVAVNAPPQVLLAPFGFATTMPLGKVSVTATPVCV